MSVDDMCCIHMHPQVSCTTWTLEIALNPEIPGNLISARRALTVLVPTTSKQWVLSAEFKHTHLRWINTFYLSHWGLRKWPSFPNTFPCHKNVVFWPTCKCHWCFRLIDGHCLNHRHPNSLIHIYTLRGLIHRSPVQHFQNTVSFVEFGVCNHNP